MIKLKLDYFSAVSYSLVNNRVNVVRSIELINEDNEDVKDIILEYSGEFFKESRSEIIPLLCSDKSLRIQNVRLIINADRILDVTETVMSTLKVKVMTDTQSNSPKLLTEEEYEVKILPFDYWMGTSIMPQFLASFVLPNHPAVNAMVVKASAKLKELSGSSSFNEYQTGDPNDVRRQVAAIYGALHDEGIVYRAQPASYETLGQRVTLPDQVLTSKLGNCIELTILFASVLESVGIHSGIVIEHGHAYLAVWLVDDCCQYSVCDDASYIEKKCSEGIAEMMVIECTQITAERTSFEDAQILAAKDLADTRKFEMFIDIQRCRLERIHPLPQRIVVNGKLIVPLDGVPHDECVLKVREHSRYDLTKIMDTSRKLSKMDIWERKLLDFSLRNSMLNLYLRLKAIQLISFDVNLVEDHLQDGEEYVIVPKPDIDIKIPEEDRMVRSKLLPELHPLISEDIKHKVLHSYRAEAETRNTLKNIYRAARNAVEETGANALYLAIGTLRWYESEMNTNARYAPIIMLPVEMVYKKGNYYIRTRDEETVLNITLIEFLHQNYNITIPGLDPLPKDDHGVDVSKIFAIIREVLKDKKRWDVEEECVLGIFSFNKYLMWNDMHNHRNELLDNDIVRSLVEKRPVFNIKEDACDLKATDKNLRPDAVALPVPVDSSQMAAVVEAGEGHSFILYGPPGTGKSQTITNLIANALFQGKRVLFVAEKMAALNVVQSRLEKIGLGPFCLEMHSNKITKRHVLDQLKKALNVTRIVNPEEYQRTADQLFEQRNKLIAYLEALHDIKGTECMSLYDCIVRYESIGAPMLDLVSGTDELSQNFRIDKLGTYRYLLSDKYSAILNLIGHPSKHPLLGLKLNENDLADRGALSARMSDSADIIGKAYGSQERFSRAMALKSEILRDCDERVLAEDATTLYNQWREIKVKWFLPRLFAKKAYLRQLRLFNPLIIEQDVDAFLSKLMEYHELHNEIAAIQKAISAFFDVKMTGDELPDGNKLQSFITQISNWQKHFDQMRDWYQWCANCQELKEAGLDAIARHIEAVEVPSETLCDSYLKTMFKHIADKKISESSVLRTFEGTIFDETVSRYKKLTEDFQILSQKELYARLAARVPRVTDNIDSSSEIGIANRNISNGGRGTSLRSLLDQIPTLLPRLCPCMLMSPMSVAQFLNLSQEKYDLVIFDEASQMPTSEAVGAIARGKAVVVVGDPKQMPPTSFFTSTNVNEDEADIDDMESILEDCRVLEIPSLQLSWHYRSKHESLIAFSNNEYYEGSLITFPSVDNRTTKVRYVHVDGVYDKGGRRSNRKEAEAIVNEIALRLRGTEHAQNSIGVIAFSVVQQNLIEDLLIDLLEKNKDLREAADEMYEPIFVKNLENVQGDERDIILFSIGYGPDKDGKVSMNFGPLNNSGGERRLNVAVSRARREMMIFSSLRASQIDLKRSQAKGVEGLKHFLEYAEQQILISSAVSGIENTDSIISEQIAAALRHRGYKVDTNVGRSNFKLDVAIADDKSEGNYLLGILFDGRGYHATQTTRDREVVQPAVLSGLGWKVMRVWCVDWLTNPDRVISRIEQCLKDIEQKEPEPIRVQPQNFEIEQTEIINDSSFQTEESNIVHCDIANIPSEKIEKTIIEILREQLSIPADALTLIAAKKLGFARRGRIVEQTLQQALQRLQTSQQITIVNGMYRLTE